MTRAPIVSAVIPTVSRPQLVPRAVRSALRQTLHDIEVIVVVDGPDDATIRALEAIDDQRLRIEVLPRNVGGADARNAGVRLASAPWVAFLDHDDEWLPTKLEWQLRAAEESAHREPVVSCCFIAVVGDHQFVWPRRAPHRGEPISEYLFCRRSPFFGEGVIPSSALFVRRTVAQAVPFRRDAGPFDDLDWLLRVVNVEGVVVEFVPTAEPLMVWYRRTEQRRRVWPWDAQRVLRWTQANAHLMTRRAYSGLLLTWCAASAAGQGRRDAFWPLLGEALRHGQPSPLDLLTYVAYWLVPYRLRRYAAAWVASHGRGAGDRGASR
jgi:glycosyltransferase involved in cell wall biosynthesis